MQGFLYVTVEDTFFLDIQLSLNFGWSVSCFVSLVRFFWVPTNQQCLFRELTIPKWNADNAKILLRFFDIECISWKSWLKDIMAGQPTPPNVPSPPPKKNKALWSGLINHWFPLNKALLSPYFWGGTLGGDRLTSHEVRVPYLWLGPWQLGFLPRCRYKTLGNHGKPRAPRRNKAFI